MKTPGHVANWVLLSAFLNCAGWILSAFHQLNAVGYALFFVTGGILVPFLVRSGWLQVPKLHFKRLQRRFRRLFPAAFLVLALMALLGGLLHPPSNYDAFAYRLPRLLNWLAEGQWHWIHTSFHRLNTRSCGYEWLASPILVFLRTDRPLFLIDFVQFLMLPGLFFSVLTRLGVRRRAAWHWMWLLPTGYCYLTQAASIGNDLPGDVFALIALDFALRARASKSFRDLGLSILAVALLTGSKASNIPLGLPWLIAVLPALPLLWRRPLASSVIGGVAALSSFLPMAALNYKYCGDWTGWQAERAVIARDDVAFHIRHNCIVLLAENLAPPVFPLARQWNEAMVRFIPQETQARLARSFEPVEALVQLPEVQVEENAGIGFGVTGLLLLSFLAARRYRKGLANDARIGWWRVAVLASVWVSLLPFLQKAGWSTIARLTAPYQGLMALALLPGAGQALLVRRAWWRALAVGVFAMAGLVLMVSPARPLWPAQALLGKLDEAGTSRLLQRAQVVYSTYDKRWDAFAPLRSCLPADAETIGLITFDDPETSLWRPFGQRRFRHVTPPDSATDLRGLGIKYVLVSREKFTVIFSGSFEQWLARVEGRVLRTIPLKLRAGAKGTDWQVVELGSFETARDGHGN